MLLNWRVMAYYIFYSGNPWLIAQAMSKHIFLCNKCNDILNWSGAIFNMWVHTFINVR